MILPAIFFLHASACTPDGIDKEQPESSSCEAGFILDGSACVPESCGTGRWGDLPVGEDTVYVDVTAEEGGDGTEAAPYATIQDGLNRAGALGGGLVAVAAGTYPETLSFTVGHADVRLAGRCRDLVILDASVGDEDTPGIEIDAGYAAVEVVGLKVWDSRNVGLELVSGLVEVRDIVVSASRSWGLWAYNGGFGITDVVVENCHIDGNNELGVFALGSGTRLTLRDTTVMDTHPNSNGEAGRGIEVESGAAFSAEGCLIDGNTELGLIAMNPGTDVTLRETTVSGTLPNANGGGGPGIWVEDGATLSAEDCLIVGNREHGLFAVNPGTQIILGEVTIKGASGEYSRGIEVQDGATLSAEGCLIDGKTEVGVMAVHPGTQVTFRDTTVRNTQPDAKGATGRGIEVALGAALFAEGCLIDGNTELGLSARNPGTDVTLRDTTVASTLPNSNGESGRGIEVEDGATLSAEGCLIVGNREHGLFAANPDTQVTLEDVTIKDTQADMHGEFGRGVEVSDGATLTAEGCLIDGNRDIGLYADLPDTRVTLRDTTIQNTSANFGGVASMGIMVINGAALSAEDCLVEQNDESGLIAASSGTRVILHDTTVRSTHPNANGEFGRGIEAADGANLTAEGCLIEGNTDGGLFADNTGTQITLRDTAIRNTLPDANGVFGRGIEVEHGAVLSAEGCLIDGNTEVGVKALDSDSQVTLLDTTVRNTRPNANGRGSPGIEVSGGAALSVEGCLIDGNTDVGLLAGDPGTRIVLWNSTISRTRTGIDESSSGGTGLGVEDGAIFSASHLVVVSNQGAGLLANGAGAMIECLECSVEGNQFAGAAAIRGGTLIITDSAITGTTSSTNLLGGAGIYAWPWIGDPPTVILTNTLIRDNPIAGVWLIGNGTYVLSGNTISGGIGEPFGSGSRCGDAILARNGITTWDGSSGLLLQDNVFQDASGSGIFLDGSSAQMSDNTYSGNAVDLVVQNQSCNSLPDYYSEAPLRELCPFYGYPTCYAEFFFVAMPADPVDREDEKAFPRFQHRQPVVANTAKSIHPILPTARPDHSSYPNLSR